MSLLDHWDNGPVREAGLFDEQKHKRGPGGRFAHVAGFGDLQKLHPDHGAAVLHQADRIDNFSGAQNHVRRFEVDPETHHATIHYRQRSTFHHNEVGSRINALVPPGHPVRPAVDRGLAAQRAAEQKQASEGSMLKQDVPLPEHVPAPGGKARPTGEVALIRDALTGGYAARHQAERGWHTSAAFASGRHDQIPEGDKKEIVQKLERRAKTEPRYKGWQGKPKGEKALALAAKLRQEWGL